MPAENYVIPLQKAYDKPRTRRANVAMRLVFDFLYKHTRKTKEDVIISKDVNEFIWSRSIQKPPRRMPVTIKIEKGKVYVFLKDSKEIQKFLTRDTEKPKKSIKEQVMGIKDSIQNPGQPDTKKKAKITEEPKIEKPKKIPKKETVAKETEKPKEETPKEKPVEKEEPVKEVKTEEPKLEKPIEEKKEWD